MVAAVRRGQPLRAVAEKFGVGVATVAHWVEWAKGQRLDRVDFSDRSRAPHKTTSSTLPIQAASPAMPPNPNAAADQGAA
jgi:transposase